MGLMRTHSFARCCVFALRNAVTSVRALGFSASDTASSRSRITMSALLAVAFAILRSLSPGANSQERNFEAWLILSSSITLRQLQNLLGQEVQDHVWADWRGPGYQALAQVALDVILLCVPHATQGEHRGVAGLEAELTCQVLAGVRLDTALLPFIEQGRSLHHHQVGRL